MVDPESVKPGNTYFYKGMVCTIRYRQNMGRGARLHLDSANPKMPMNMRLSEFCKDAEKITA